MGYRGVCTAVGSRVIGMVGGIIAQWVYRGDQVPAALTERVRIALTTERDSQIVQPQELKLARFLFRRYTPVMVRRGGTL